MPFYASNNVSGATASFSPTMRGHSFLDTIWQPTTVATNAAVTITQPLVQQLSVAPLVDIRHHSQCSLPEPVTVASDTQSTSGYPLSRNNFVQTNDSVYAATHPVVISSLTNSETMPKQNSMVDGAINYLHALPRPTDCINVALRSQEMWSPACISSTPNSCCKSIGSIDNAKNSVNAITLSKTSAMTNNNVQTVSAPLPEVKLGNFMHMYPSQQLPKSKTRLHDSAGYPSQNTPSVTNKCMYKNMKSSFLVTKKNKKMERLSPYMDGVSNDYQINDCVNIKANLETMLLHVKLTDRDQNHCLGNPRACHLNQIQQQTHHYQDGQYLQKVRQLPNLPFCTPTLLPESPVQTTLQMHTAVQSLSLSNPTSSQQCQYNNNQHCSGQSQTMQQSQQQYQQQLQQQAPHSPQMLLPQTQLQQQKLKTPKQIQQQQQLQIQHQNQQFQPQLHHLQLQKYEEQQYQFIKHQTQHETQHSIQQQQHMQQQQDIQLQLNHKYQQGHQVRNQKLEQHQKQSDIQKQHISSKSHYDKKNSANNSAIDPKKTYHQVQQQQQPQQQQQKQKYQCQLQQQYQRHQQEQYQENLDLKMSVNGNNFLAPEHHSQSSTTDKISWDFPFSNMKNMNGKNTVNSLMPFSFLKPPPGNSFNWKTGETIVSQSKLIDKKQSNSLNDAVACNWIEKSKDFVEELIYPSTLKEGIEKQAEVCSSYSYSMKKETGGNFLESMMSSGIDTNSVAFKQESVKMNPLEESLFGSNCGMNEPQNMGEKLRNKVQTEIPDCSCFPPDKVPLEPGSCYTHLGAAASLLDLRQDLENRIGLIGNSIRFEKILYTGKEGKTKQGCPMAKWIIRRASLDEKILVVVKHRPGHKCSTAWIVVVLVAWEGVPQNDANDLYSMLVLKLNKFGLPTLRRCETNDSRTCACQGLDQATCGASFSFGCSWSMYYNGCKYARSTAPRKFRLSVQSEEQEVENRLQALATIMSPLYKKLAPQAYKNMTAFETEASECRLGNEEGRPFSGVTACIDFCAHSHRDMHNMNNGLTCVVTLAKHRNLEKPVDEQLHVLPLYTIEDTDEFGNRESQSEKTKNGSIELLTKYECEVKVRSVPLQPCRRKGTKRKENELGIQLCRKQSSCGKGVPLTTNGRLHRVPSKASDISHGYEGVESQVQNSQITSTVLDSPVYRNYYTHGAPGLTHFENDADTTTNNKPNASLYPYSKSNFSPSTSPMMNSRPSTPLSVSNQTLNSHISFSSPTSTGDEWSPSVRNDWNYGESPSYLDHRTPVHHSPHLQSPSIDSLHSPMRPSKFNKLDHDSALHRRYRTSIVHRNLMEEFNRENLRKEDCEDKMGVDVNAIPDVFSRQYENKSMSVDNSIFDSGHKLPPPRSVEQSVSNFLPGINGIVKPPNPFMPPFYKLPTPLASHYVTPDNHESLCSLTEVQSFQQGGTIREDSASCFQCPSLSNLQSSKLDLNNPSPSPFHPMIPESHNSERIGEVTEIIANEECFKDSQMGGVAIALGHGSVLLECAKHELHATTAVRRPNRQDPTRISLVFYQHRSLNRPKHGSVAWEEKNRLKMLSLASTSVTTTNLGTSLPSNGSPNSTTTPITVKNLPLVPNVGKSALEYSQLTLHHNPFPKLATWSTLLPMHTFSTAHPFKDNQLTDVK